MMVIWICYLLVLSLVMIGSVSNGSEINQDHSKKKKKKNKKGRKYFLEKEHRGFFCD